MFFCFVFYFYLSCKILQLQVILHMLIHLNSKWKDSFWLVNLIFVSQMQDGGKYERIQQHSAPELQFCCTCMMTIKGYSTVFYNLRGVLFCCFVFKAVS